MMAEADRWQEARAQRHGSRREGEIRGIRLRGNEGVTVGKRDFRQGFRGDEEV